MNSTEFFPPIISAVAITVARMLEIAAKRDTIAGPVREKLSLQLFLVVGMIMFFGSIAEFLWEKPAFSWPLFAAGWACGLASFYIRRRAIAALGKFWSLHVEIRDNHQFVQSGPFRFVRHPTYFSMILELLAIGLLLKAVIMLIIIPALFFPVLLWRIKTEEVALVEKFGDAYRKYQADVPALLPLWRKSS
jgi:protein-S-isoprenylcysteine O-methyltransferase Ste14